MSRLPILLLLLVLPVLSAQAQQSLRPADPPRDQVEFGGLNYSYNSGISPWKGAVVRTQFVRGPKMVWLGEAVAEHRFGEPSFAYKLQHSADFGAWITRVAGRTSNGGFYNPRFRADVMIGRKLPPSRRFIVMVGGFYREVRDGHQDMAGIVEAQLYLSSWIILQGSTRYQISNPGHATSLYHDAALTLGKHQKATVVLHAASGTEAYQIIDPLVIYTDFESRMARVVYRQWLNRSTGFTVSGSWYENPFYQRTGIELSFFFGFNSGRR